MIDARSPRPDHEVTFRKEIDKATTLANGVVEDQILKASLAGRELGRAEAKSEMEYREKIRNEKASQDRVSVEKALAELRENQLLYVKIFKENTKLKKELRDERKKSRTTAGGKRTRKNGTAK